MLGISSGAKLTVALTMIGALSCGRVLGSAVMITAAFAGAMLSMGFVLLIAQRVAADAAAGCERRDDWLYLLGGDGFRHYLC